MERVVLFLVMAPPCFFGCGQRGAQEPRQDILNDRKGTPVGGVEQSMSTETRSANFVLMPGDYDSFRPGRSMDEILADIQWRGNFEMATEHYGKSVTAISYSSVSYSNSFWAIFVDGKFRKFVPWPEWFDNSKTLDVGDFRPLIQGFASEALSISDLKEVKSDEPEPPTQVDAGLTAAWLLLREGVMAAHQRDLKRNAALRDQFNASRLKLGMSVSEVESVLTAKPIESGEIKSGFFKLYGSTESLDIVPALHYSNILVLFKDGRVSGIYSGSMAPGGKHGLEQMRKVFVGLS